MIPNTTLATARSTSTGQSISVEISMSDTAQVLGPQKSIRVVEDICKEYDIREPGRYSVRVEVQDPEHPKNKIKSNVIVFTLTSP